MATNTKNDKKAQATVEQLNKALEVTQEANQQDLQQLLNNAIAEAKDSIQLTYSSDTYSKDITTKLADRTNVIDSYYSKVVNSISITVTGSITQQRLNNNSYGFIGKLTAKSIVSRKTLDLGIILQDSVILSEDYEYHVIVRPVTA